MPFEALRSPLPCCSLLCSSPLSRLDRRAADPPPMDDIAMVSEDANPASWRAGSRLPLRVLGALFHT